MWGGCFEVLLSQVKVLDERFQFFWGGGGGWWLCFDVLKLKSQSSPREILLLGGGLSSSNPWPKFSMRSSTGGGGVGGWGWEGEAKILEFPLPLPLGVFKILGKTFFEPVQNFASQIVVSHTLRM